MLILFATEILRVYFIMPFPGSQHADTVGLAYSIEKYKWLLRIVGIALIAAPAYRLFVSGKTWKKIVFALALIGWFIVAYFFNFRFEADKMFYQPVTTNFSDLAGNTIDSDKLVIGVEINGDARAFPIQLIGYHHQVRDTIGGEPVMITYCTVCRTGRVYSPVVSGHPENFRLVGMDHFNAMFEDRTTKSWWRQATGVAVAGPLTGSSLKEIPSHQLTLAAWARQYPNTKILQPDTLFKKDYDDLADFDKGTVKSHLEKRDSVSWKDKSWVVGIRTEDAERAYDWNDLVQRQVIQDSLPHCPLVILLEQDTASFRAYSRRLDEKTLWFTKDGNNLTDTNTRSSWNSQGICLSGPLKDRRLEALAAYQEFWHSWRQFHPNTTQYKP